MKINYEQLIKDNIDIWNCSAAKYFGANDSSYLFKLFLKAVDEKNKQYE